MSILIGWESPLDQYFMAQPARLFGRPIEHATIDPTQPMVLEAHAVCAAAEHPLVLSPELDLACFSTGGCVWRRLRTEAEGGNHQAAREPEQSRI